MFELCSSYVGFLLFVLFALFDYMRYFILFFGLSLDVILTCFKSILIFKGPFRRFVSWTGCGFWYVLNGDVDICLRQFSLCWTITNFYSRMTNHLKPMGFLRSKFASSANGFHFPRKKQIKNSINRNILCRIIQAHADTRPIPQSWVHKKVPKIRMPHMPMIL